jgi:hypothetical protein
MRLLQWKVRSTYNCFDKTLWYAPTGRDCLYVSTSYSCKDVESLEINFKGTGKRYIVELAVQSR